LSKVSLPHVCLELQSALIVAPKAYPLPRRHRVRDHGQYRSRSHFFQSPRSHAETYCLNQRDRWDSGKRLGKTEPDRILAGIQYELWHQALLQQSAGELAASAEARRAA
jgi:hypothetical protein